MTSADTIDQSTVPLLPLQNGLIALNILGQDLCRA